MTRLFEPKALRAIAALAATLVVVPALPAERVTSADQISIRGVLSQDALRPGDRAQVALVLEIRPGWHVNSAEPGIEGMIGTTARTDASPDGLELTEWSYPTGERRTFEFSGDEPLSVYEGTVALRAGISAAETLAAPGRLAIRGTVRVQACNDKLCLRPGEKPFEIDVALAPAGAVVVEVEPALFAPETAGSRANAAAAGRVASLLEERGTLLAFGVFFLWGLGLCLTPCVFPMIPITAGYFANQAAGSRGKALLLAFAYVQGLAIVYGVLGTVAGLTGQMLGAALQRPAVLIGIAAVLVALSLSMFGLYEFRIPGIQSLGRGRAGAAGAFVMGAILGVVAAPCIGPFSLSLLAYVGQRQDPFFGFWAFLTLAEGLGLPFLLLAVFTGVAVPRGGPWMEWVKKVFGVLILGLAVYFVAPLLPREVRPMVFLACAVAGAIYVGFFERSGRHDRRLGRIKVATGVVVIAAAVGTFWATRPSASALDWKPFTTAALEADLAAGRPAVVDFFADWCIPCIELEHRTFSDPRVAEILSRHARYKADLTVGSATTRGWEERFDVAGVPTVLFFGADGRERVRVQQFVDAEGLLAMLAAEGAAISTSR